MRGPALMPRSMARFKPKVGPARSRMLVKPLINVRSASAAAARLMKPMSAVSNSSIGRGASMACQCASIRPGMRVRPPPSMTSAPSGGAPPAGSITLILLPSTTTRWPSINRPDLPSNILTFVNTTGPAGASGIAAEASLGQRADAPTAAAPARNARRENFCSTRALRRRNAGLWQIQPASPASSISPAGEQTNKVVLLLTRLLHRGRK